MVTFISNDYIDLKIVLFVHVLSVRLPSIFARRQISVLSSVDESVDVARESIHMHNEVCVSSVTSTKIEFGTAAVPAPA